MDAAAPQTGLAGSIYNISTNLKRDVSQFTRSGAHYVTPNMARELDQIGSGADHIRLDHSFLTSSKDFRNNFNPQIIAWEKSGAANAMHDVNAVVSTARDEMQSSRLVTLDNASIDKRHQIALNNIVDNEREMIPFVHNSVRRIQHFCDHVGVTDRYTGYRNNLNRGNRDPLRLGYSWLDTRTKNPHGTMADPGWVPGNYSSAFARQVYSEAKLRDVASAPVGAYPTQGDADLTGHPTYGSLKKNLPSRSIQERCGINMTFPGITEYKKRYSQSLDTPCKDYLINPSPNFAYVGRPMGIYEPTPNFTEYQTRFEWPDGTRIVKLPWLRQ